MNKPTQRRLAAIVSADVVGYSKLMGVDEVGTLAALRAHRAELIDAKIAEHGGRIVKTMGDGLLLEFPSVVDATTCAIEMQEGMAARNAKVPDDKRITFRIGVNLGDIIIEGEDILGDGVNIAARVEALAEPGGVAISGRVHDDVRDRLATNFTDAGEQALKNIARPVQVWQWVPKTFQSVSTAPRNNAPLPLPNKPSVAVLPFDNMSGDPEHQYFADGIAEDIITALSKVSRMRVIARNSTFAYKGQEFDLRRVASELGVRYVVEGSVRSGGNRLRITAQLIDADDGSHIWAERYDRTVDDIFDIQDEITKEIVTALRVNLTDGEEANVLARGTNNIDAWQLCVRAAELLIRFNTTDYLEARQLAQRATECDPDYAYAWAVLGLTFWWDGRLGFTGETEAKFERADAYAERARALDETVSWVIGLSVHVAGDQGDADKAVAIGRRGFELNPGNADVRGFYGIALTRAGMFKEAVEHYRAAISLNPFCPNWYRFGLARNLSILAEFDEALVFLDEIHSLEPTHTNSWVFTAYVLGKVGRTEEAEAAVREVRKLAPHLRLKHAPNSLSTNDEAAKQRFIVGLRQVGFPE